MVHTEMAPNAFTLRKSCCRRSELALPVIHTMPFCYLNYMRLIYNYFSHSFLIKNKYDFQGPTRFQRLTRFQGPQIFLFGLWVSFSREEMSKLDIQLFHHIMEKCKYREAESQWYAGSFDPRPYTANRQTF